MAKKQTGYVNKLKTKLIFFLLLMIASDVYALKVCKDENGRAYFTDMGCPEGTINQDKLNINESNTYRTRDSINIDILNDYERRHNTGRNWRWVKKKKK
ncbi:MAG: DUF4124 domain-containing protein [Candidatus Thiodiazotropha sp. (ex Monitilora ramsayi)]|nr:DUF4124 domain-containing protein [Candidatus Thiodiazotropha sp. (ex Monitilora ramsayi)]